MGGFKDNVKKFLPYLEDVRRRLYRLTIVFIVVFVVGFFLTSFLIRHVVSVFDIPDVLIATTSPFQFADVAMDVGFFIALMVTIPLAVYSIFSFASSAMTRHERFRFLLSVPVSVGLFVTGFSYGFFILYYSFGLLARLNESLGIKNIWDISSFLSQIFITSSLLGIVFQFPLILTVIIRLGLMDVRVLREKRRFAYFIVCILVALLPPTDGLSLLAMALPLVFLYEATILLNRHIKHHVWIRN